MPYQTMILALLAEQPMRFQQLRTSQTLRSTAQQLAHDLKTRHQHWIATLQRANPQQTPTQITNAALEIAVEELRTALQNDSPPSDPLPDPISLDHAMAFLRHHTPPA
jgi:hypothetical protein